MILTSFNRIHIFEQDSPDLRVGLDLRDSRDNQGETATLEELGLQVQPVVPGQPDPWVHLVGLEQQVPAGLPEALGLPGRRVEQEAVVPQDLRASQASRALRVRPELPDRLDPVVSLVSLVPPETPEALEKPEGRDLPVPLVPSAHVVSPEALGLLVQLDRQVGQLLNLKQTPHKTTF